MKKIIGVIVAAALVVIMLVTCPDASTHKECISQAVNDYATQKIDEAGGGNFGANLFTTAIASKIIPMLVNSRVTVSNYFLFSVGRANIKGEQHTVSFGILGHVFTFDKDDIDEIMEATPSDSDAVVAAE